MESVEKLLTSYENGHLSRRQLLTALAILTIPAGSEAQSGTPILNGRNLHHISLHVADVARSEAFYRHTFALPASRKLQGNAVGFDLPGGGLVSIQKGDPAGRLDHFCIGVSDFSPEKTSKTLKDAGQEAQIAGESVFVRDPDGIRVQISAPDWKG